MAMGEGTRFLSPGVTSLASASRTDAGLGVFGKPEVCKGGGVPCVLRDENWVCERIAVGTLDLRFQVSGRPSLSIVCPHAP